MTMNMTNHFDSHGGDQTIAQGENAIGKQENTTNVTVNQGMSLKPCTVLRHLNETPGTAWSGVYTSIVFVVLLPLLLHLSKRCWGRKEESQQPEKNTINVTVNQDISQELLAKHAKELGATEQLLKSFLNTLLEREVPRDQWDSKLRKIAAEYKELLARVGDNQAAKEAIERGDYAQAEMLLRTIADQRSMAAAEANADLAKLQEMQLRYTKAAAYWQQAAALLPKDKKKEQAYYLNAAGDNLKSINYKEAMALYEQSLRIRKEIGDREGEGTTLTNIGEIYRTKGDRIKAWDFLNQSLDIHCEVGNRAMESTTLNNISQIYHDDGDYTTALKYLERSLRITQEIDNKKQKGATLKDIGEIYYDAWGDCATALKYLKQSLAIRQEIGDRRGEAETSRSIGRAYKKQDEKHGDLKKAETHMTKAVQLAEEIGHPELDEWRKELTKIRAESAGLRSWLRNLTIPSWMNGAWH